MSIISILKEYIEDRIDYERAVKASEEFEKNPITFTVEEVMEELL